MAYEHCRETGASSAKLAKLFKVSVKTIHNWRHAHDDFLHRLTQGKDQYDCQVSEKALNKRVRGYRHVEITKELVEGEMKITKRVSKSVAPDVSAIKFHLTNRHGKRWPDKQKVEHSGQLTLTEIYGDISDKDGRIPGN